MRYDGAFAPTIGFLHCYGELSVSRALRRDQSTDKYNPGSHMRLFLSCLSLFAGCAPMQQSLLFPPKAKQPELTL
jgi:hypothetical protein